MSDYQAVYDAVRSRITGGDIGDVVFRVALDAFDMSHAKALIAQEASITFANMAVPSAIYRPTLSADGTKWCALYGENLQEGVAGFGDTPAEAMAAFDAAWISERTPAATKIIP